MQEIVKRGKSRAEHLVRSGNPKRQKSHISSENGVLEIAFFGFCYSRMMTRSDPEMIPKHYT